MKRKEIKEKEIGFLAGEYKRNPALFEKKVFIDSPEFLEKFGIFLKSKGTFPSGYIKLWPQDFIVEEISKEFDVRTINKEDFLNKEKGISEDDPTLYATLVKCNLSTIEVAEELSENLNFKKERVQFAGIKDKDAITSQLISFRGVKVEDLQKIVSPYFFLKNVYSGKGIVEVGSLAGNCFTILVRTAPSFQKKFFLERLKEIEKNGFFNFFYLQRFGVPRLINFYWGLFILRGEYQKAVLSFLCSPGQRELSYSQKIRREIKENWGDWKKIGKILAPFPLIFRNEKKIVDYLKEKPKDFIGALNQIQDQVQLWLFAYASLLFNKKISFYLKRDLKPPQKMPLIFSKDKEDWLFYEEFLKENGVSSTSLKNLKPFPFLQWRKREIKTKEKVKIQGLEIIPEGVIFNFTLAKGIYATTFLAHLFNLVAGLPPKNISYLPVDTKATLKQGSLTETLNCFKEVISPKTENIFAKL